MTAVRSSALVCLLTAASLATAADHRDAPALLNNGRLDINDIYAFRSPTTTTNTVLIMTVNPLAGVLSPMNFDPTGKYEFKIDTNGDAAENITFELTFGVPASNGSQSVLLRQNGRLLARGRTGDDIRIRGGGTLRCDLFDDPFFFDLMGFSQNPANINFVNGDFLAGFNVSAIVLEIPSSTFGSTTIGIWARTANANGTQVDRTGLPAINTALIPPPQKNNFNAGVPANDLQTFGTFAENLITGYSGDRTYAQGLVPVLLPDIMPLKTDMPANFSMLNGRLPEEDVIDVELGLLTNGGLTTDNVNANDVPFPNAFPYLAPPQIP